MTSSTSVPEEVDYIVVGGGLAGLVVAARLSEDASKSVLIIEAGKNRKGDPRIDTPGLMTTLYDDPDYDWMHMSVPQVRSLLTPAEIVRGIIDEMVAHAMIRKMSTIASSPPRAVRC
jgi:choline dehydrogenase-like flavoprotein